MDCSPPASPPPPSEFTTSSREDRDNYRISTSGDYDDDDDDDDSPNFWALKFFSYWNVTHCASPKCCVCNLILSGAAPVCNSCNGFYCWACLHDYRTDDDDDDFGGKEQRKKKGELPSIDQEIPFCELCRWDGKEHQEIHIKSCDD